MANFGLFPEGLLTPTLDEIRGQFEQAIRDRFGANTPLGEDNLAGFIVGGMSERLSLCHEILEQIFSAIDPDKASSLALRAVGTLNGTLDPEPQPSTVDVTLCGDSGTVVPPGTLVQTPDTRRQFATDDTGDSVTLLPLSPWVTATIYAEGDQKTNTSRCYQCIAPGLSGAPPGPISTDADIADGAAHWTYVGEGDSLAVTPSSSVEIGPIVAVARGLTDLVSVVPGLNTAINLEDAQLGFTSLTDEEFRLLREAEVAASGTGTNDAMVADLRRLGGVRVVEIFENDTPVTDADGLPGCSFEILIQGGDDQEIRNTIQANRPTGIRTHGNVSGTALDAGGKSHVVKFSRPVEVPIYVDVTLLKDPSLYSGDDAVKSAVATIVAVIGADAVAMKLASFVLGVAGVTDVPRSGPLLGVLVGLAPSPTSDATVVITSRQLATYAIAHTTISSSDDPNL